MTESLGIVRNKESMKMALARFNEISKEFENSKNEYVITSYSIHYTKLYDSSRPSI